MNVSHTNSNDNVTSSSDKDHSDIPPAKNVAVADLPHPGEDTTATPSETAPLSSSTTTTATASSSSASASSSTSAAGLVVVFEGVRPMDVICAQNRKAHKHLGNRRYQEIIQQHVDAYCKAPRKEDKSNVTRTVIQQVKANGSRFVKFSKKTQSWMEIDANAIHEKVSHALRNMNHQAEKKQQKQHQRSKQQHNRVNSSSNSVTAGVGHPHHHRHTSSLVSSNTTTTSSSSISSSVLPIYQSYSSNNNINNATCTSVESTGAFRQVLWKESPQSSTGNTDDREAGAATTSVTTLTDPLSCRTGGNEQSMDMLSDFNNNNNNNSQTNMPLQLPLDEQQPPPKKEQIHPPNHHHSTSHHAEELFQRPFSWNNNSNNHKSTILAATPEEEEAIMSGGGSSSSSSHYDQREGARTTNNNKKTSLLEHPANAAAIRSMSSEVGSMMNDFVTSWSMPSYDPLPFATKTTTVIQAPLQHRPLSGKTIQTLEQQQQRRQPRREEDGTMIPTTTTTTTTSARRGATDAIKGLERSFSGMSCLDWTYPKATAMAAPLMEPTPMHMIHQQQPQQQEDDENNNKAAKTSMFLQQQAKRFPSVGSTTVGGVSQKSQEDQQARWTSSLPISPVLAPKPSSSSLPSKNSSNAETQSRLSRDMSYTASVVMDDLDELGRSFSAMSSIDCTEPPSSSSSLSTNKMAAFLQAPTTTMKPKGTINKSEASSTSRQDQRAKFLMQVHQFPSLSSVENKNNNNADPALAQSSITPSNHPIPTALVVERDASFISSAVAMEEVSDRSFSGLSGIDCSESLKMAATVMPAPCKPAAAVITTSFPSSRNTQNQVPVGRNTKFLQHQARRSSQSLHDVAECMEFRPQRRTLASGSSSSSERLLRDAPNASSTATMEYMDRSFSGLSGIDWVEIPKTQPPAVAISAPATMFHAECSSEDSRLEAPIQVARNRKFLYQEHRFSSMGSSSTATDKAVAEPSRKSHLPIHATTLQQQPPPPLSVVEHLQSDATESTKATAVATMDIMERSFSELSGIDCDESRSLFSGTAGKPVRSHLPLSASSSAGEQQQNEDAEAMNATFLKHLDQFTTSNSADVANFMESWAMNSSEGLSLPATRRNERATVFQQQQQQEQNYDLDNFHQHHHQQQEQQLGSEHEQHGHATNDSQSMKPLDIFQSFSISQRKAFLDSWMTSGEEERQVNHRRAQSTSSSSTAAANNKTIQCAGIS
ncbi:hypothetical protein ACA910_002047 [Epithemia clementina (nom. ined.)]